jgi:hypothetical protein
MTGMFLLVLWLREQTLLQETAAQFAGAPEEELSAALAEIRRSTFNANLLPGIVILFLKAALLSAMTLLISTIASSAIFGMITASAVYFIGHLQATARDMWLSGMETEWWTRLLTGVVALLFPDLQTFTLTDAVVAGTAIPAGIFWQTFALGWLYIGVYYLLASFLFAGREL